MCAVPTAGVPLVAASAGAIVFDGSGRLLILKPTYKSGWTIPGGAMDATESPWAACRREVAEETGIELREARLAAVDFRPPRAERAGGIRFLFDAGSLADDAFASIVLQAEEIEAHRLVEPDGALELLSGPIRRRVAAAIAATTCVYLEDGRPIDAVPGGRPID